MDEPDTGALKSLSERVACDVLERGFAFCDGYSRLFTTLCDYAGIKSEVITGYANGSGRARNFTSNHRWNAVFLDSTWHLLDVTWASGYVTFGDQFIQHDNDFYFLTNPKDFAREHLPEDPSWALLTELPVPGEFQTSPFKTHSYLKNHIQSYYPEKGIIEASVGDTIFFQIQTSGESKNLTVLDTAIYRFHLHSNRAIIRFYNIEQYHHRQQVHLSIHSHIPLSRMAQPNLR